jgi:hypothetical protein
MLPSPKLPATGCPPDSLHHAQAPQGGHAPPSAQAPYPVPTSQGAHALASCRQRWRQAARHAALPLLALLVTTAALLLEVPDAQHVSLAGLPLPQTCVWRATLGFPCAGCGLTRSFVALVHGEWSRAVAFHPLGPALFALIWAQIPYRGLHMWQAYRGRPLWKPRCLLAIPPCMAAALLAVWLWRTLALLW